MTGSNEAERRRYIYERKSFLNQKSYDIFEKYQISIFGYIAYVFVIFTKQREGLFELSDVFLLLKVANLFLGVFALLFLVVLALNIVQWLKYEREENTLFSRKRRINPFDVVLWTETWLLIFGLSEAMVLMLLSNYITRTFLA